MSPGRVAVVVDATMGAHTPRIGRAAPKGRAQADGLR